VRNNSVAMIGTVAVVAVLGWWIGFFDPETCSPDVQLEGWTSCAAISEQRNLALAVLIGVLLVAGGVALNQRVKRARQRKLETLSQDVD
jgi:hypothetical protein